MRREKANNGMKVFVYRRGGDSRKVATLTGVTNAISFEDHRLMLVQKNGDTTEWNTKEFKLTLYQN